MLTRSRRAALCAFLPFCLGTWSAQAQTNSPQVNPFAKPPIGKTPQTQVNPFAKSSASNASKPLRGDARGNQRGDEPNAPRDAPFDAPFADARFGRIEIDQSRARGWDDLIETQLLQKRLAALDGALAYREGALGFYRVGYEAIGNRNDGTVGVTVTIVGQSGDRTILANSQSVQRWRNGVFLYQEPTRPRDKGTVNNSAPPAPRDTKLQPASFRPGETARVFEAPHCAPNPNPKRDGKRDDDKSDSKSSPKREEKRDDKPEPRRAPDPAPKREERRDEKPRPERAPDPAPQPKIESKSAPDPNPRRDDNDKPRDDRPKPNRAPKIEARPAPQPQAQPQSAPDPFGESPARVDDSPRPAVPVRPPILRAPDPNPPRRPGTATTAPNPNPPTRGGTTAPDPNPPTNGGYRDNSRPPYRPRYRRPAPVWDGPYGDYPYPYPYPVPYPYPYPVPYPVPVPPDSQTTPPAPDRNSERDGGARLAFDYALAQARAEAEADFDRQLRGEPEPDNAW